MGALGVDFVCLFLKYSNREAREMESELAWAQYVCSCFQVPLHYYEIDLARPHSDDGLDSGTLGHADAETGQNRDLERIDSFSTAASNGAGLEREEYERFTKEIRLHMYAQVHRSLGGNGTLVVIMGHHKDDCDENRLEQLSRGHLIGDMDGMSVARRLDLDSQKAMILLRPFLSRRKRDFFDVLQYLRVPYARDSTPPWSVRGRFRKTLDSLPSLEKERLLSDLDEFSFLATAAHRSLIGQQSSCNKLDDFLQPVLEKGVQFCVCDLQQLVTVHFPERGAANTALYGSPLPTQDSKVAGGDHDEATRPVSESFDFSLLADSVTRIRYAWNERETSEQLRIPESQSLEYTVFERLCFRGVELVVAAACLETKKGHFQTSKGLGINRKSIRHVWINLCDCKKQISGWNQ